MNKSMQSKEWLRHKIFYQSPVQLVIVLTISIFISEALSHIFVLFLPPMPKWVEAIYDSTVLIGLVSPLLYFFMLRPLNQYITRLKRFEEALHESEERYRSLYHEAPITYMSVGSDGRIRMVNKRSMELLGYPESDLLGREVFDLYPDTPAGKEKARVLFMRFFAGEEIDGEELEMRRADGRSVWVSLTAVPILDAGGHVLESRSMVVDITDRRRIEEELLRTRAMFQGLFESAPDAIVVVNREGRIVRINTEAEKMFGYSRDEVLGQPLGILIPERFRRAHEEHIRGYIAGPRIRPLGMGLELYGIRKDGSEFPADIALGHLETEEGIVMLSIIRDITESMHIEEALRESETRYRMLFEKAGDAIFILEAVGETAGHIIEANHAAAEMHGYTVDELLTMKITDLDGPDVAKEAPIGIERILRGEFIKIEITHRKKDGTVFPVEISAGLLELGNHKHILAFYRDITERKHAEEKLKQTLAELERSNKELELFAYVASHDLQEPLRMVASFTQLLVERYKDKLGKDADEFIAYIVDGAARMQRMINDLLTYSRAGRRSEPFQPADCEYVLDRVLVNLKVAIEESGAVVTHDPLPVVIADATQMVQLFQNLIGNAIKFHGEETPRVHVCARQEKNEWVFSVKDNGIGIAPEFLEEIFIIFQRLHTRSGYPGTGIGLAICKKIVEQHGGRIWVESLPGKGSTFYFTIPE